MFYAKFCIVTSLKLLVDELKRVGHGLTLFLLFTSNNVRIHNC